MLPPCRMLRRKTTTLARISAIVTTGVRSVPMLPLSGNTRGRSVPALTAAPAPRTLAAPFPDPPRRTGGPARWLPAHLPRSHTAARPARAHRRLPSGLRAAARGRGARAGGAVHGLRCALLPRGLPAREPDPGLERPRLPRRVAGGDRPAPRHERLPGVHRPHLPGALRAGLRPGHQRRPGDDQADRAGDR